jgi:hypothetical protein
MKKTIKSALVFLSLSALTLGAQAQDCTTDPTHPCAEYGCPAECIADPDNYDPNEFDVPFDGGVSLIALGGAALGVWGLKRKKKN